jgi:hypothetical protein
MPHPAMQAVERYYTLFNEKDWPGITAMFDLPATILVGPRKVLLEMPDAVTALYRGLEDKCAEEGVVRLSWNRGSFALFQVHDDLAIVKTVVTREGANRTPIKTWNCSYTLRLVSDDWLFTLITSDDVGGAKAGPTSAST